MNIRRNRFGLKGDVLPADTGMRAGEACPPDHILLSCHRGALARRERKQIIDHLSRCRVCSRKYRVILRISSGEDRLLRNIESLIRGGKYRLARAPHFSAVKSKRRALRLAVGCGALIVVFGLLIQPFKSRQRNAALPEIQRNEGYGETVAHRGLSVRLTFASDGFPIPRRYFVDDYDYGRGQGAEEIDFEAFSLAAPPDHSLRLGIGRELNGQITHILSAGGRLNSVFGGFTLRR